jgi:hypothetical protein
VALRRLLGLRDHLGLIAEEFEPALIWAVLIAQVFWEGVERSLVMQLVALTTPLFAVYWARERLGYARASKLALVVILCIVLYLEGTLGFTPSAALLSNTSILLTTLLFGERAFPWALGAGIANLGLGWLLHTHGFVIAGGEKVNDPGSALVWTRHALVLVFLAGAVRDMSRNALELEQERLLNDLGAVLASSLDAHETLGEVSHRMVQHFADLFVIERVEDGHTRRVMVMAREPSQLKLADELRQFALDHDAHPLDGVAWQTHAPELAKVTRGYLEHRCHGAEHLSLLETMGARSIVSAPMIARGRMFGILVAVSTTRLYDEQDLQLLVQVAARTTMAVENATLHAALQRAHTDLGTKLTELQRAQQRVRTLKGLLPICAWCGRIRDDQKGGVWRRLDQFVAENTQADVSHGICPECVAKERLATGRPQLS